MHIVYLTGEYPTLNQNHGGVGSFIQTLGIELVKNGISVSVVGVYDIKENVNEKDNGIQIFGLTKSNFKLGKFYQNTKSILNKLNEINTIHKIDIVEGAELAFAFFPKKNSFKKVIRMHGGHNFFANTLNKKISKWKNFQEHRSFYNADFLIAVSNYVGTKTKELLKCEKPFKTIYNPIDLEKFYLTNEFHFIPFTVLFTGTICEKKGVKQLVQAMKIVNRKLPNVVLNLAGRDWFYPDGKSFIEELKNEIIQDSIKNISFLGSIKHTEIPSNIEKSEICIFPSHMEAMPIAWLEALAMGKPVIVSNIPPGFEIIEDGISGKFVNPKSPEDIAEKIIWMFENKEKSKKIGITAAETIREKFNITDIVIQNINFYKNLL